MLVNEEKTCQSVNIICEETVRYSFVSHLAAGLRREGISVSVFSDRFPDDKIHGARVSVVVFSSTCASGSPWIQKIIELRGKTSHEVISVLYGVKPSDMNVEIRNQSRLLFIGMKESIKIIHTDSELVEEIVRDVYGKLCPTERIGVYSRLLDIENLLCEQPWEVRSLGIWGMPGIGKTTLAKAVFDHLSIDYDISCFIDDFDEVLYKEGSRRLLEEKIGKHLKEKFGLRLFRDKLCDIQILVVLDDVRDPLAAESFLRRLDWLGPGSLIILTSRYRQVFNLCQISHIYEVQGLNKHEALELFSQSAFEKDVLEQNYKELSMKVIDYASGNPLALCIYGQELKGKNAERETAFLELKQCPPQKIQDMLKSVYSTLGDNEKYIFLVIACFFKGENVDYVVQLLKGCGCFSLVGIDVLVEKCLVTISGNMVQMNDLIQDIIREIISGVTVEIKKCGILWKPSSIRCLLEVDELKEDDTPKEAPKNVSVNEDIKGIFLDISNLIFDVNPDAFKDMVSLRFLKVFNYSSENVPGLNFPKGLNSLPCELRLLHWEKYPFVTLPQDFDLQELVELNMPYSQLKKLMAGTRNLEMLKRIRLCNSWQLVEFSIHGCTPNVELIDLQGCKNLEIFPAMTKLQQHLRVLNLSGCGKITVFPGLTPNIEELYLLGTSIVEIPTSILSDYQVKPNSKDLMNHLKNFPGMEHVDLLSVKNLIKASSYNQVTSKLVRLNMKDCVCLESLPDMFSLESLQFLDLTGCTRLKRIMGFPRNMKELYLAKTLVLELPELPKCLELLNAHDCVFLKSVCLDFEQLPRHYTFSNCFELSSEATVEFLEKCLTRVIRFVGQKNQERIKASGFSLCIPALMYGMPSFKLTRGSFFSEDLAHCTGKAFSGFVMSVLVSFRDDCHNDVGLGIRCVFRWVTKTGKIGTIKRFFKCWAPKEAPGVTNDHMFVFYDSEMRPGADNEEGMEQVLPGAAGYLGFEFLTVSGENKLLRTSCRVEYCDIKVIMDSKGDDTSSSAVLRATDNVNEVSEVEELPPPENPEPEICSPPSSKPRNPFSMDSMIKSTRNVFLRWVGRIRVKKTKRELKEDEAQDSSRRVLQYGIRPPNAEDNDVDRIAKDFIARQYKYRDNSITSPRGDTKPGNVLIGMHDAYQTQFNSGGSEVVEETSSIITKPPANLEELMRFSATEDDGGGSGLGRGGGSSSSHGLHSRKNILGKLKNREHPRFQRSKENWPFNLESRPKLQVRK